MERFDEDLSFNKRSFQEMLEAKDRIIETAKKDMESLKREIVSLKKELNYSKSKKK